MANTHSGGTLFKDIFTASRDAIMVHETDSGTVIEANPAAGKMLGMDPEDVVSRTVGEFSPPGFTTEDANEMIQTAVEDGSNNVEWSVRGPDGEQRWVDVALERATIDGTQRVVAYVRDITDHKRLERQYRAERDMLDRLLDVSPNGVVIHDSDGTIVQTNQKAQEILGVDAEELVGETANPDVFSLQSLDGDPVAPEDIPANEVLRTETEIRDRELVVDRADGSRIAISVSATPLFEDGDLDRIIVGVQDISERRERELQQRERSEQLRTLVDNLPVVVFTLDSEGTFVSSGGKGLEALGVEPGQFEGLSVYDVYEDQPGILDAVDRALTGEEVRMVQEIQDLVFETWYQPVHDDFGELTHVVGVARDITELKQREERVERLSEATRSLLYAETEQEVADSVTEIAQKIVGRPIAGMWSYDQEDDTLYPIGATTQATAFGNAEEPTALPPMGPETDEHAIFADGDPVVIEDYQTLDNPSAPGVPLRTLLCLPLDEYAMLCIGSPEVGEFDDTERYLLEILASTATAALDRVEHEQELRQQRQELERSNQALQQFAYIASHDLQEPLRMVSSYIDLLEIEYGDELDGEAREYMEFAVDGANRMKEMIDGLLAYSRVATQGASFESVDPNAVLDTTLAELSLFLEDAGTTVEYDDLPEVTADSIQVGQVFQNLIKNAVVHGGADTVRVDAMERDGVVEFAVEDDGHGIDPDEQDDIFGIFEQGYEANEGSGIGLAVCERVVHRHDGEIWVESDSGDGATFFFTLPRQQEGERR